MFSFFFGEGEEAQHSVTMELNAGGVESERRTSIRQGRLRLTVAQHPTVKVMRMTKPPIPINAYVSITNMSTNSCRLDRIPANQSLSKNVHRPTARIPAPDNCT